MNISMLRTRWAAIGAAVAITLGAGGIGLVSATSPAGAVAYVPITPCRLVDTRPAPDTVGTVNTPVVAGSPLTVAAHGENGNCKAISGNAIPATATGLQLNVTGLGASSATFVTVWPAGVAQPVTSNLNLAPGAPATPNAVTTGLSADGKFTIANGIGSVNVIVDIVGYYTDHNHDDRYYTEAEVNAALAPRPVTATGKMSYAWVCNAAASSAIGTVSNLETTCNYEYNVGGAATSTHNAAGQYTVTFPNLGMTFGHVQVTAYGSGNASCKVGGWGASTITVLCFDAAGAAVDSRFTVLAIE